MPLVSNAVYYVDRYAVSVDLCTYSSFVISRRGTTLPSFFPSTSRPPGTGDQVYSSCPELCGHTHKTSFFSTYCRTDRTCNYYYSRTMWPRTQKEQTNQKLHRSTRRYNYFLYGQPRDSDRLLASSSIDCVDECAFTPQRCMGSPSPLSRL